MRKFVQITVVSSDNGKADSFYEFPMLVRVKYVAAVNIVLEPPHENVKSIVYFSAESGLKPVLSSLPPEKIVKMLEHAT